MDAPKATNKPRQTAKPTVKMQAMELNSLPLNKLTEDQRKWVELVLENNAPGQVIHADKAMIEACQEKCGVKPGEDVQGQHGSNVDAGADVGKGKKTS